MSRHTDNATIGLQDARTAIFIEMGDVDMSDRVKGTELTDKLEDIGGKIDEVKGMIKEYVNSG